MKEFKYVITDKEGIHARPAGELIKVVKANFFPNTFHPIKNILTLKIETKTVIENPVVAFTNNAIPVVPPVIKLLGKINIVTPKA